MRLDFNVLWVDDQARDLGATVERLKTRFRAEGFELKIEFCTTMAEVAEKMAGRDNIFANEIDLALVDWELGSDGSGDDAIEVIRDALPYKDVVFYSSKTDTSELRKLVVEKSLDGVYVTNRAGLVDEAVGVFQSLIKKALDLDHIRGIVLGATSDIEHMIREIVILEHERSDDASQKQLLEDMVGWLDGKVDSLSTKVREIQEDPTISKLVTQHHVFTAYDCARALKRILKRESAPEKVHYIESIGNYITEVIPKRNILGHRVLTPEGRLADTAGGATTNDVITFDDMKNLRIALLELRQTFRDLQQSLT